MQEDKFYEETLTPLLNLMRAHNVSASSVSRITNNILSQRTLSRLLRAEKCKVVRSAYTVYTKAYASLQFALLLIGTDSKFDSKAEKIARAQFSKL